MTRRDVIEEAFVKLLTTAGIKNVRVDVNTDKVEYPITVVNMAEESKENPRLPSEVTVEIVCESVIGREDAVGRSHYDFVDNVRQVLDSRGKNGMYQRLWGAGLAIGEMLETIDGGTEIDDVKGGALASTVFEVRFRLLH